MSDNKKNNKNDNNQKKGGPQPPNTKRLLLMVAVLSFILLAFWFYNPMGQDTKLSYDTFLEYLKQGRIETDKENPLVIDTYKITGQYIDGGERVKFFTNKPPIFDNGALYELLNDESKSIVYTGQSEQSPMLSMILFNVLPILLLVVLFWFMFRQFQGGGNKAFSFGKSKARKFDPKEKITFNEVAGINEAKEELAEVVDFLKDPQKFTSIGARIPKGVLLVGPPGTGKTLLSRAVAGEAGVNFFYMSGSDFVEMFVGVGASRVRDLFEQGKKNAPCILFIDELDAVGRTRGAGYGGGHDEREQTLNQLLVEMDGFDNDGGVILLAATNRPDVLDPALMRPGRFDRQVVVDNPDLQGREAILKIHTKKIALSKNVDHTKIARATPGFSGADLANMVNEAALLAARFNKKKVSMAEFEEARDKVVMGVARKSRVITKRDKEITSVHEAGHVIVNILMENSDDLHKVTIIPRGMAAGLTWSLPGEDHHVSKAKLLDDICIMMAGRVAEEVHFKDVCTGASNDINRASEIARKMVTQWGMSEKVGPIAYGQKDEPIFIGKEIASHKDYSDKTSEMIDSEIQNIIDTQYKRAKQILTDNEEKLNLLATTLFEKETLEAEEIYELIGIEPKTKRDLTINSKRGNVFDDEESEEESKE